MIDTHTHLYSTELSHDIDEVINRAAQAGVQKFYMPAIDSQTHEAMLALEARFPESCVPMMGLHPCSVNERLAAEMAVVENYLAGRSFAAVGEAGLDFYWDTTHQALQYRALHQQIELALHYQLPIVLHTRHAMQQTIDIVKPYAALGLKGIFHCFGGSLAEAKEIVDCGFLLGIGGVLTFKKSGLDVLLQQVSMEHIVLETDSPYLAPVPYRGKRNESAYLMEVALKLAEVKKISFEEVDEITTRNALQLFEK